MDLVRLRGVGKRYGAGPWVLEGVDLRVAANEVVAITGTNGSGKSTLLRILVGLSRPSAGEVLARPASVGYVPERFPAKERMTAIAYLRHMGRVRGLSTSESDAGAHALLDRLALVGGATTPLRALSKGNAQKVALAQALLPRPKLLVLDEPWSGLDVSAHGVLAELLAEVAGDGGAVVFTDHRESVVRATASAAYRIDGGRLGAWRDGGQVATVDLVAAAEREQVDWPGLPGVLRADHGVGSVMVVVEGKHCDELLVTAIRSGWSVAGVRRAAPSAGEVR
ncbi:ABC transporter ATP-binding protein [Amycolatopsis minnesotensis]|uniref:ABC transporter ATP-binding protein n=1 Tax=Amycolatopsis minnesotensis TaxID=337894 RepID=A0ABN2R0K1_9PSEU